MIYFINFYYNFTVASILVEMLFACKFESQEELSLEQFTDPDALDEESFDKIYRDKNYLDALKSWLPFLYKRGFLDAATE